MSRPSRERGWGSRVATSGTRHPLAAASLRPPPSDTRCPPQGGPNRQRRACSCPTSLPDPCTRGSCPFRVWRTCCTQAGPPCCATSANECVHLGRPWSAGGRLAPGTRESRPPQWSSGAGSRQGRVPWRSSLARSPSGSTPPPSYSWSRM
eukprot:1128032-Prymnesium_polylepis.1